MATTQVQTVSTGAEKAKLATAAVLALGSLVAFYLLAKQGPLVQWAVLLVVLAAAVGMFVTSEAGKQLIAFGRDAWKEVKKVVWPERKEAVQITAYVFGFVLIMALVLFSTDKALEWVIYDLFLGWKK